MVDKILAVQNGATDAGVTVTGLKKDAAGKIEAAVTAIASAKDGEHLWYLETAKGQQVASTIKLVVVAPEPAPVLLRVSLSSAKAGDPAKAVTIEGERLDKVKAFQLYQNGAQDGAIQVTVDSVPC